MDSLNGEEKKDASKEDLEPEEGRSRTLHFVRDTAEFCEHSEQLGNGDRNL